MKNDNVVSMPTGLVNDKRTIGIFHPTLNMCGGAEWVGVSIINSLKNKDYKVVILTNEKINQEKIMKILGKKIRYDKNIILPFEPFPSTDIHNIYTDALRTLYLKSKCDVLIDTFSNAILPGVDFIYMHYPFFGRLQSYKVSGFRTFYYLLYRFYEKKERKNLKRLIMANSKYTANATKEIAGIDSVLLYPPVSKACYVNKNEICNKENIVVSVARISRGKRVAMIPHIARLTNKNIRFLIVGLKGSNRDLNQLFEEIKRNKVSDRVKVLINVPREQLLSILRTSKVFLHPARGEHFGVAIAEALASGCIPVVHNSGGPVEFIPELNRFDGPEEASRKIDKAILNWSPQLAEQSINLAQPFNEENFSINFLRMFDLFLHYTSKKR